MFAGIIGFNLTYIFGSSLSSLEASGIGIKAQQLAKSRANEINALAYKDIRTYAPEAKHIVPTTSLYRQTTVGSEISNADGSKSTVVTIDVFRNSSDNQSIFSLPATLSNKADVRSGFSHREAIAATGIAAADGIIHITSGWNATVAIYINGACRAYTDRRDRYGQGRTMITAPILKGESWSLAGYDNGVFQAYIMYCK